MSDIPEWKQEFLPKRDVPFMITVPKDCCHPMMDTTGKMWCEVFVPPRDLRRMDDVWSTIVVEPEHVFYYPSEPNYYVFWVNAGAMLNLYYKELSADQTRRVIVGSEQDVAEQILVRFLQYEAWKHGRIVSNRSNILREIEQDYLNSGMTMLAFIKTLY